MENNSLIFHTQVIQPLGTGTNKVAARQAVASKDDFQNILESKLQQELKFSRHAQERLRIRNINLNDEDLQNLSSAISKAKEKGAKDSLVLMGDLALVVSVKNNTVITAVDGPSLKENVFTNIDSTVII
ncbi:MAG: flagellar protein [Syntrophomonadaceae bacterium]|jgi:flagellar operon protein|nr:flagellar protein [Syntrophomonadaceae bacterium]